MEHNLEFIRFRIKNTLYFKDEVFYFNRPGVHLILGQNLNSGGSRNPNAVGKSLFFSLLAEFICDEPLIGSKLEKVREGSREFTFRRGKNTYVVTKTFVGRREVVSISRNGTDLQVKGKPTEIHAKFRRLLRLSNQEVYSLVYFDSRVPHPLAFGDTSARREFFNGFFRNLSSIKDIRKLIDAEFDRIKTLAQKRDTIEQQLSEVMAQIPRGWREDRDKLQAAEEKLQTLTQELPDLLEVSRLRKAIRRSKEELPEQFRDVDPSTDTEKLRTRAENSLEEGRKGCAAHKAYAEWVENNKELGKELKELHESFGEYDYSDTQNTVNAIEAEINTSIENIGEYKSVKSQQELSISLLEQTISADKERVAEHLECADTCPTCGAEYDNKKAKSSIEELKERIVENRSKKKEREGELAETLDTLKRIESSVDKKIAKKIRLQKVLEGLQRIRSIERELSSKEKEPEQPISFYQGKVKKAKDTLDNIHKLDTYFSLQEALKDIPIETRRKAKTADVETLQASVVEITKEVATLASRVAEARMLVRNKKRLQVDLENLSESSEDLVVAETLKTAFDKKNIELMISKSLGERLQEQINRFSKVAFGEDYVFSVDLTSKYEITVTRFHGKKQITSDVRKLSGAEGSLFPMVLLMSVLSFVPKTDRPNVLILDEPTAHMGESNVERFVEFLRSMRKIIPTIVVITPLDPSPYKELDPSVWTVQKKGSQARFLEGYPS